MFTDRKTGYKLPPTTIRDRLVSQETRRSKALEEQKRRRAKRVDSSRQLDLFAGLNLGGTDDEDDAEDEEHNQNSKLASASVAQYAAMLQQDHDQTPQNAITSFQLIPAPGSGTNEIQTFQSSQQQPHSQDAETNKKHPSKSSKKRKNKKRSNKPSKWADKCMYAELLEMYADEPCFSSSYGPSRHGNLSDEEDGLPRDLESAWVAMAPVPVGKRCLAVTHQSAGVVGVAPNTTLRSRLLGKTLIHRFPSSLPPLTILDCILDANWRDNGILHVLDVVKWKGQDVGDCEAGFRFWWRDTRLAELSQMMPPSTAFNTHFVPIAPGDDIPEASSTFPDLQPHDKPLKYHFPYPTSFIPVPYHTSTTLTAFEEEVIPAAKSVREMRVFIPPSPSSLDARGQEQDEGQMDVEHHPTVQAPAGPFTFHAPGPSLPGNFSDPAPGQASNAEATQTLITQIQPDGLLLYVAEASYEPGTSPLSSWVPIVGYDDEDISDRREMNGVARGLGGGKEGPLDLFQRLVRRRLSRRLAAATGSVEVDIEMDI